MERLTQRIDGYLNIWGRTALYEAVERPGAYLNNAIVRLAAYEDTGLTPEEVMALATAEEKRKTRLANMQVGKTLGGVPVGVVFPKLDKEMPEYIDRAAALLAITEEEKNYDFDTRDVLSGLYIAGSAVESVPAADVEPVRHGRWEKGDQFPGWLCCSDCRDAFVLPEWVNRNKWEYCPNCGAKMDGDGDGGIT